MSKPAARLSHATNEARQLCAALQEALRDDPELKDGAIEMETDFVSAVDATLAAISELDAHTAALGQMKHRLDLRRQRMEASKDRLRLALQRAMDATDMRSLVRPAGTVSLRQGPGRIVVTDPQALPPHMLVHRDPNPDLRAISSAIKAGQVVPGAHLSNGGVSLVISAS